MIWLNIQIKCRFHFCFCTCFLFLYIYNGTDEFAFFVQQSFKNLHSWGLKFQRNQSVKSVIFGQNIWKPSSISSSTVGDRLQHIFWILIERQLIRIVGVIFEKVIEGQLQKADQLHEVRQSRINCRMDWEKWASPPLVNPVALDSGTKQE